MSFQASLGGKLQRAQHSDFGVEIVQSLETFGSQLDQALAMQLGFFGVQMSRIGRNAFSPCGFDLAGTKAVFNPIFAGDRLA